MATTKKLRTRDWPLDQLLAEIDHCLQMASVCIGYAGHKDEVKNNPELDEGLSLIYRQAREAVEFLEPFVTDDKEDE